MAKEILFRAKRMDTGEWVEGLPGYSVADGNIEEIETRNEGIIIVDPDTICRYTGLTDRNGHKIFEGNIVKLVLPSGEVRHFKVTIKSVVRKVLCHPDFDDKFSTVEITGVVFEWQGYELFPCVNAYGVPDYKVMEVVGNIFDNPELLEVGD